MNLASTLPVLLGLAWLLPLVSFALIVFFGPRMGHHGRGAAHVATAAIVGGFVLSLIALIAWVCNPPGNAAESQAAQAEAHALTTPSKTAPAPAAKEAPTTKAGPGQSSAVRGEVKEAVEEERQAVPRTFSGEWYTLAQFGRLRLSIGYYIDALTVIMFTMVTLIASCIHLYASGYMHDELHDVTDHEVTLADGQPLHRKGRFHRFFQYLSLFCFSMLGLVIAGNIFMVFVFWELVGICSYFLIGFYIERKSASTAANKAFIVNRVGDFGMIIGLMAIWGGLGTFAFGDTRDAQGNVTAPGIFSLVRPAENDYKLQAPDGLVRSAAPELVSEVVKDHAGSPDLSAANSEIDARIADWRSGHRIGLGADNVEVPDPTHYGYLLLVIAGLGIFCGCVGKSAQFPLHTWLPDAMEGPTPVSALVHSATMVAAGVYLVGRFYPMFTPLVLLVIAIVGCITLALAALIAITAVDIKRVLAYSTISQLGYMMLALGVGGWLAGLFHLITHAFFKSLLFLCSGSVIHATHTNDMRRMGGLRHKMPWTAYTMLVGCLAISGGAIPFLIGFSGYYSKDGIISQALSFKQANASPWCGVFYFVAVSGAAVTAFYMFRLWYLTFAGTPRDAHVYEHAHESPKVMYVPLVILAVFALAVGWPVFGLPNLLEQARPAGVLASVTGGVYASWLVHPSEHIAHEHFAIHGVATIWATAAGLGGILLATIVYLWRLLDPTEVAGQFSPIYRLLWNKFYFDELYNFVFVQPVMFISRRVADFDRVVIDGFINWCARAVRSVSSLDDLIDRWCVDGLVNLTARWIHGTAVSMRGIESGRLRQYVMWIVVGTVGLFVLASFFWNLAIGS